MTRPPLWSVGDPATDGTGVAGAATPDGAPEAPETDPLEAGVRAMFFAAFAQTSASSLLSPTHLSELASAAQRTAQELLDLHGKAMVRSAHEIAAVLTVASQPELSRGRAIRLVQAILDVRDEDEAEQWRRAEDLVDQARPQQAPARPRAALPDGHVADVVPLRPRP